jgi:hypothetical protein
MAPRRREEIITVRIRVSALGIAVSVLASLAHAGFNGSPAVVGVYVTGCQGYPLEGARAVLVGEAAAEELGEGRYRFDAVAPGAHRLLVYADYGDVYDEALVTTVPLASAELEVMLCLCVGTRMTRVEGTVRDAGGKAAKGAGVAVHDLFLDTTTDAKGHYEIELPPGTWEVTAWTDGTDEYETFVSVAVTGPEEPGEEMPLVELDLTIE